MENKNLTGMQVLTIIGGAIAVFYFIFTILLQSPQETPESAYEDYLDEQRAEAEMVRRDLEEECEGCYSDYYCSNMGNCEYAKFCMNSCGLTRLDGDGDGIPCKTLCH